MRDVAFYLKSVVLLGIMIFIPVTSLMSQHTSRDNFTGFWEAESSWNPSWPSPENSISGYDINIYGYITIRNSLSFSGSQASLTVYDTLVVNGDLVMDNNSTIKIAVGGILIVRGMLKIQNQGVIAANGYLIVGSDFIKSGSANQGSFTSNDNPVRVFIGGSLVPASLNNNTGYPVLNCVSPVTQRYKYSGCSYGNMADLAEEGAIWDFYQATCGSVTATGSNPVCEGSSIILDATPGGTAYLWSGPDSFTSTLRNPVISNAALSMAGTYKVKVTFPGGCTPSDSVSVEINPAPLVTITSPPEVCSPATVDLTTAAVTAGSTPDLIFTFWTDSAATKSYTTPSAATTGTYFIKGSAVSGCYSIKPVIVKVNLIPIVSITSSPNAMCLNDQKPLTGYPEGGTFTVVSGPGIITGNDLSATETGDINITYTYTGFCTNTATQTVHFFDMPVSSPGPDQVLRNVFETQMNAELTAPQIGEWSLVSGSGTISDIHSPTSKVTELEIGESVFRWKVVLGSCQSGNDVKISVLELFIPSVITPNGDGKNDFFTVYSLNGHAELVILNRWGNVEYSNRDYKNDWNGKNDKGADLKEDTYFYILKFENGLIKKGSVVITR